MRKHEKKIKKETKINKINIFCNILMRNSAVTINLKNKKEKKKPYKFFNQFSIFEIKTKLIKIEILD